MDTFLASKANGYTIAVVSLLISLVVIYLNQTSNWLFAYIYDVQREEPETENISQNGEFNF